MVLAHRNLGCYQPIKRKKVSHNKDLLDQNINFFFRISNPNKTPMSLAYHVVLVTTQMTSKGTS